MRERKTAVMPSEVVNDDLLSDAEFRLLAKLGLKFGTAPMHFTDDAVALLNIKKSTFYRLLSGLMKREYLQYEAGIGAYRLSVSKMGLASLKNETGQSQIWENETATDAPEKEEERTKEEDKDQQQSWNLNNNSSSGVKENDKEKEILKKEKDEGERFTEEYRQIIGYLNEKTGKKYSAKSRVNQGHMSARLREGFTVDDFKKVIDVKCFQWKDDQKMAKFLRPETLFGTKFDRYLNEEKYVIREGLHGEKYMVTEEEMNSDIPF